MADNKGLTIEKEVLDDLSLISGDKDKLANMLNSLVDNAMKFTDPGGKVTLAASEEDVGTTVHVSIPI